MPKTAPPTPTRHEAGLQWSAFLPCSIDRVFEFFSDAANLQAITPPWVHFRITTALPIDMHVGTLIDYQLKLHGLPVKWRTRISAWEPPYRFVDEQLRGPYRRWIHEHTFAEHEAGTICKDRVRYVVPGGPLAPLINRLFVEKDVQRIFAHRARRMAELLGEGPVQTEPATAMC